MFKSRMKSSFTAILLLLSLASFGQRKFEKGYFVNNSGNATEAWIEISSGDNAYHEFQYKLAEDAELKTLDIGSVSEYGVPEKYKFKRFDAEVDVSAFNKIDQNKEPSFETKKVFLRVLIEGKASLYQYRQNHTSLFFFHTENSATVPQQLIYKKYYAQDEMIGTNTFYRQQLFSNFQCGEGSLEQFKDIDYTKKNLSSFFAEYNECIEANYANYANVRRMKTDFNLAVQGGMYLSQLGLEYQDVLGRRDVMADNIPGVRVGLEAEIVLPFYRHKLAVVFEPNYQRSETEKDLLIKFENFEDEHTSVTLREQSVYLPFGLKHYFHLNDQNKVFLLAEYIYTISHKTEVDYAKEGFEDIEFDYDELYKNNVHAKLGVGYKFRNTYGFQVQYVIGDRKVAHKYNTIDILRDESFSFVLSYNFL